MTEKATLARAWEDLFTTAGIANERHFKTYDLGSLGPVQPEFWLPERGCFALIELPSIKLKDLQGKARKLAKRIKLNVVLLDSVSAAAALDYWVYTPGGEMESRWILDWTERELTGPGGAPSDIEAAGKRTNAKRAELAAKFKEMQEKAEKMFVI